MRGVAREPAAIVLQSLRQVPVIQHQVSGDAVFLQGLEQALVKGDAGRVPRPLAVGLDARPGHRKAISIHAERRHQRDVFAVAVIMVAGDVAVAGVEDVGALQAEGIPDRRALAVGAGGALDQDGAGGDAQVKPGGKCSGRVMARRLSTG